MENNKGWITLHRSILEWEWYDDVNTKSLFIHLLLVANHCDKEWKGILIKRGQVLTGRLSLAKTLGLSEQQIRTSITHLISTNEITKSSTAKYTVITIVNYDKYQNKQPTEQPTINQQINQVSTTTNNVNKYNKYKGGFFKSLNEQDTDWVEKEKLKTAKLLKRYSK